MYQKIQPGCISGLSRTLKRILTKNMETIHLLCILKYFCVPPTTPIVIMLSLFSLLLPLLCAHANGDHFISCLKIICILKFFSSEQNVTYVGTNLEDYLTLLDLVLVCIVTYQLITVHKDSILRSNIKDSKC